MKAGKFDFRLVAPEEGGDPFSPFIHIVLRSWSADSDRRVRLSAQLMTEQEIDRRIQTLKEDLDRVAHQAKQALKNVHPGLAKANR